MSHDSENGWSDLETDVRWKKIQLENGKRENLDIVTLVHACA